MLSLSIVLITLALAFYTVGVWTEHRAGTLTWRHLAFFAAGLVFDISGTTAMAQVAAANPGANSSTLMGVMQVTGSLALALMAAHLIWGVVVRVRNRPRELATFHRLSLIVWAIWLIPYFTGAIGAAL